MSGDDVTMARGLQRGSDSFCSYGFTIERGNIMTTKENRAPDWGKVVKPDATPLKEAKAGQICKLDSLRLVVLNDTYRQMGRQYGLLLGDELKQMCDLMNAQLITFGLNRIRRTTMR